jgi:hypothetical protein
MNPTTAEKNFKKFDKQVRAMFEGRVHDLKKKGLLPKFSWEQKVWDLQYFCSGSNDKAYFIGPRTGSGWRGKEIPPDLIMPPWLENFSKLAILLSVCEEGGSTQKMRHYNKALRWLSVGISGASVNGVHQLLPYHFNNTIDIVKKRVKTADEQYNISAYLKKVSDTLDDYGLTDSKIGYINLLKQEKRIAIDKRPSEFETNALMHCINNPVDDNERVIMEICRLHFVHGGRILETLRTPASVHFKDKQTAVIKVERFNSPGKFNYGLRHYPAKNFAKGVTSKPLDPTAGEIAAHAVNELERLCAPARNRAKLLNDNPGRFPLPRHGTDKYHDQCDLVTLEDIGRWFNWEWKINYAATKVSAKAESSNFSTYTARKTLAAWGVHPVIRPPSGTKGDQHPSWKEGRGLHAFKYRVGDIENAFLKRINLNVIVDQNHRPILKLHETLCVMFENQFYSFTDSRKGQWIPLLPKAIDDEIIRTQLGISSNGQTMFQRRHLKNPDGTDIHISPHQPRHIRNAYLDEAGLSQIQQALSMGRSIDQNKAYQGGSDINIIQLSNLQRLKELNQEDRLHTVKQAIRSQLINGPITRAYHSIKEINAVTAEEFLEEQVGQVLVTRYGACTNEWTGQSCPKHNKCFKNCKHLHLTGIESERVELEHELKIQMLHRAKVLELASEGAYRADTALSALDSDIAGIKKAIDAWHEAFRRREKIETKQGKLSKIPISVQVFESGVSNYRELNRKSSSKDDAL